MSAFSNSHLVQSYSDYMVHCHFTAAAVKKGRRRYTYTIACTPNAHKKIRNLETSIVHTTPVPRHLVLATTAVGIPKLYSSNPLQTHALPLGELDLPRLFPFTADPNVHPRGVYPSIHDENLLPYGQFKLRNKSGVVRANTTLTVVTRSTG